MKNALLGILILLSSLFVIAAKSKIAALSIGSPVTMRVVKGKDKITVNDNILLVLKSDGTVSWILSEKGKKELQEEKELKSAPWSNKAVPYDHAK